MRIGSAERYGDFAVAGKCFIIKISHGSSGSNVFIKMFQFNIENCGLQSIKPAVAAHHFIIISFSLAVVGNHPQFCCQFIIIGENGPAVTIAA